MWFEPRSVVSFHYPIRISRAEDIPPFLFKWDTRAIVEGYRYFENKWQMDITEGGKWPEYLVFLNSRLGLFPRMFPNAFGIFLDRASRGTARRFGSSRKTDAVIEGASTAARRLG